jgi:predicted amidohydrolase YtcJ
MGVLAAFAAAALAGGLAPGAGSRAAAPPPTLILHHGRIVTMEARPARAQAIALRGRTIVALGSNASVLALRGPRTRLVSLRGRAVLPGFVDPHSHGLGEAVLAGRSLGEAQAEILASGVTARGELFVPPELLGALRSFAASGQLQVRTSLYLLATDNCGVPTGNWWEAQGPISGRRRMLRIPGVKIFADGGSCGRAAVSWEYPNGEGGMGDLLLEQAELDALVARAQERGFQTAIHALGDRGLDAALTAIDHVLPGRPNRLRHRIEHNALVRPDQLGRHAEVGALATVFGVFGTCAFNEGGFARGDLVPEVAPYLWRWRELLDANPGAHVSWHSDWPIFELDPFEHLYSFATRRERADGSLCEPEPEQANDTIPVATALRMMTVEAAYALGQDSVVGSLRPGKLADLVVVSADPLAVPVDEIPDIAVMATLVGGTTRYCNREVAPVVCP